MPRFGSYDYEYDAEAFPLLTAHQEIFLGPFYYRANGPSNSFGGSVFVTVSGQVIYEQSFDGGLHYDVVSTISVISGMNTLGPIQPLAPVSRLRYKNGANAQTGTFRLFASVTGSDH